MDDRKVFELERLRLAYHKQVAFMIALIVVAVIGLLLYIYNIYSFNFALFIVSLVLILTGIIGIMSIDQKMKLISNKIKIL